MTATVPNKTGVHARRLGQSLRWTSKLGTALTLESSLCHDVRAMMQQGGGFDSIHLRFDMPTT